MSKPDKAALAEIKARAKTRAREKEEKNNILLREHLLGFAKSLSDAGLEQSLNGESADTTVNFKTDQPADEIKTFFGEAKKRQGKKRNQQITETNKLLREKNPVSLAPVLQTNNHPSSEFDSKIKLECEICQKIIPDNVVIAKCNHGHQVPYHFVCWQRKQATINKESVNQENVKFLRVALPDLLSCKDDCHIFRLYHYLDNKLVEKVAMKEHSLPQHATQKVDLHRPEIGNNPIDINTQETVVYNGPSWRSIDVSAYEKDVGLFSGKPTIKNRKQKPNKYLDLSIIEDKTWKEKHLTVQETHTAWKEIFAQPEITLCAYCEKCPAELISYPCRHFANCFACNIKMQKCGICVKK